MAESYPKAYFSGASKGVIVWEWVKQNKKPIKKLKEKGKKMPVSYQRT